MYVYPVLLPALQKVFRLFLSHCVDVTCSALHFKSARQPMSAQGSRGPVLPDWARFVYLAAVGDAALRRSQR